ncbi:DUF7619 domain-containing protein [Rufibacter psychrotolerans]|uniref:DUF7619 domain-containing protein n=1 Tax=Rufibacter psychrotolerans TaxID=2812556 RepID=UPI0019682EF6|nr:IPT/TIG domain-containing protein [Rufibacter sp. SYSU D00308]
MKKVVLPLLCFLFLLLLWVPGYGQAPAFELHKRVGAIIGMPDDIAIDSKGDIYVTDFYIRKFSQDGQVYHDFKPENLDHNRYGAFRITLDQHDNLYVVSYSNSKIAKFSKEGKLLFEIGSQGQQPGQFLYPEEIAVNSRGEIYVADKGNRRIQKFNPNGTYLQSIILNTDVNAGSYTETPSSLDVDAQDNLYALDAPNGKIIKYTPTGEKLLEFGNSAADPAKLYAPAKLAIDKKTGQVYITDLKMGGSNSGGFFVYSTLGVFERQVQHTTGDGRLWGTQQSIAIAPDGKVFIADRRHQGDSQVLMFDKQGNVLKKLGYHYFPNELTMDEAGNVFLLESSGEVVKFNPQGVEVMRFGSVNLVGYAKGIAVDLQGYIYILTSGGFFNTASAITKYSKDGTFIRQFTDFGPEANTNLYSDLAVDAIGNLYVTDHYGGAVRKIAPSGKYLMSIGHWGGNPGQLWIPRAVAVDMRGVVHVLDYNGGRVQQFSPEGKFIRQFGHYSADYITWDVDSDMALDGRGNVYVVSNLYPRRFWIADAKGNLLHEELDRSFTYLAVNQRATRLVTNEDAGAYSLFLSKDYKEPQSLITGFAYDDANRSCTPDQGERPVPGMVIEVTPGPYFGVTQEDGSYAVAVDPGEYTVRTIPPAHAGRTITPLCPAPSQGHPVKVAAAGQTVQNINFANAVFDSPYLNVHLSSNRRRRCFQNVTTVSYSNTGFAPAPNARVTVQLPEFVALVKASMPYTVDPSGNLVFEVGDLKPNQGGSITLTDSVSCADSNIRGLTVCTKAWITPANPQPTPDAWNQAHILVAGTAPGQHQARFVISNQGKGNMTDSLAFRVYQDQELVLQDKYKLAAQDSLVLRFSPTGRAIRVEADQPGGHPVKTLAGANLEMRGANPHGLPSPAMNAFPPDDPEPEITEECLPIIDSFDPNDKQVLPVGLTAEHYTPTNTPLRYTVRFQNTGTDVAYRVVVVDTLSADLDLSTLQVGAVSHPYRMEVSGKGRPVLTFHFDQIMLPDSAADQAGSNGFLQFSIRPKAHLPEKTLIENFADIFFDYNEPVRTNTTQNRLYDLPPVVNPAKQLSTDAVVASPALLGFSPAQGRAGQAVELTGKNFSGQVAGNKVYFDGVAALVQRATPTALTVLVPAGAFTGQIKVVTPDGAAQSSTAFTIFQPPTIASVSPAEAVPGTLVTLTGTHFSPVAQQDTVTFNGVPAQVVEAAATRLRVRVPDGATFGKIRLKTLGGEAESPAPFMVWYAPTIAGFTPSKAKTGTTVVLTGTNFAEAAQRNRVQFGPALAEVERATRTQLQVRVPAGATSGKILVQTPGGEALTQTEFTFVPAPVITSFSPASGHAGTQVTITGTHFGADGQADTVYFNGQAAPVLQATATTLVVRAPKHVTTGALSVAGAGGKAVAQEFTVPALAPAEAIALYPTPTRGALTVNWYRADFKVERVNVYNAIGQAVHGQDLSAAAEDEVKLSLGQFGPGVYTLRFQTSVGLVVKRVVVL